MISKKDQLLNLINLSNIAKSNNEDQMDIDQNEELNIAIQLAVVLYQLETNSSLWTIATLFRKKVNQEFEDLGFPIAIGAINETHIPLNKALSKINKNIYISRKYQYGIYLQEIVDHKGYFISYNIGWPASVHDAKIMTPFKDPQSLNAEKQKYYNTIHSKARVVIKQAFGRLKARFSFLKEMRLKDTTKETKIINIALILHNFIEKNNNK
ncbi:18359_t:CDS:2 [Racocetra persica]|uniref:18359_t:CDS:1 n=1 Tax=Racocetra persica TaxID=160502 RepID=A0ACA9KFE9_9GLOM|nr:18359_t:CDS:2 [Racocetra persica]